MKRIRVDIIIAALLIGLGIAAQGILPRYTVHNFGGDHAVRFDTWTGITCSKRILGTEEEWRERPRSGRWTCSR